MSVGIEPGVGQGLLHAGDRASALVVAVGDPEGVGRRAVADDLAVDPGAAGLGVLELLEHQHPGPLAQDEAVAIAIERTAGACRLVVAGREGGQEDEAGHAEGMDHAVRAAGEDHVGTAAADQLERLADRLGAGGAGGQAVGVEPLAPKTLARWPAGVPGSCSASRIGCSSEPQPGELGRVDLAVVRRLVHQLDEPGEILLALARAQVDAEPVAVQVGLGLEQARILHRHRAPRPGRTWCSASARPTGRRRRR